MGGDVHGRSLSTQATPSPFCLKRPVLENVSQPRAFNENELMGGGKRRKLDASATPTKMSVFHEKECSEDDTVPSRSSTTLGRSESFRSAAFAQVKVFPDMMLLHCVAIS